LSNFSTINIVFTKERYTIYIETKQKEDSSMKTMQLGKGEKLSLTNNGTLEAFWIGVGSAFALQHFQTNLLLIKGNTHIMVDFGSCAQLALDATAHLKVTDLEVFLPTHSHADHIGGLECVALTNRWVGIPFLKKPKVTAILTEEYQEILWDRSLRGGCEENEHPEQGGRFLAFTDFFNVVRPQWKANTPREIYQVNYGGINIELFRTKHIPSKAENWQQSFYSVGMFLDERIFISMDTRFDRELIDYYAPRSEVMFHDVQFFPDAVHAPLADLKTLPDDVKGKMHLMHYSDDWKSQDIAGFAGWTKQGVRYIFD